MYYVLNASRRERDIFGGHETTATTQCDTKHGTGLVLPHQLPSTMSRIPVCEMSTSGDRYLGNSLVDTGEYGRVGQLEGRHRRAVVSTTNFGRREVIVGSRNEGHEAASVGYET